jgi:mannose-6-phosphate isomerase-like protein (cupin superfamily)
MNESSPIALVFDKTLVFFDGRSLIRDFKDQAGNIITFGFMHTGEMVWRADQEEIFSIVSGKAIFTYNEVVVEASVNSVVVIPKGVEFVVKVEELLDYRCTYG